MCICCNKWIISLLSVRCAYCWAMPFCFWKVQTYPLTNSFDVPSAELAKRLRYTKAEPGRASHGCVAWDRFLKLALSFHWTICSCFAHVAGNVARIFWWIFWAHDYLRDFRAFLQLLPHRQVSKLSLPLSLSFLSFYLSDSPRHLSFIHLLIIATTVLQVWHKLLI